MSPELLAKVLGFCHLENTPEMEKGFAEQFDPNLTTRRRQQANPEEMEVMRRWIEPTREWLDREVQIHATVPASF